MITYFCQDAFIPLTGLHVTKRAASLLTGVCVMSQQSRLKKSRDHWKEIAVERGDLIRYQRKELKRIKGERDGYKKELSNAPALAGERNLPVIQTKADLVHLAQQLFLVARIGFRAVSRVLGVLAGVLGIQKVPWPQTIINWVTRLTMVRMQSVCVCEEHPGPTFSNGWIWMADLSIALGTGKILMVLAMRADHYANTSGAPGFGDLHCMGVSVADSWTGESIASFFKRIIAVTGRPTAYLEDGGTDLHKAGRLLEEEGLGSPTIDDISHAVANLLKWWYEDQVLFQTFLSACGRVSAKLKQTILACLAPPKVRTKARFMSMHRLFIWANQLLDHSPPGAAPKGSVLAKLRASLDLLPSCRPLIRRFRDDAAPLLQCEEILKTEGLSHRTLARCEPHIAAIPTAPLRREFAAYLNNQIKTAERLGLSEIGMPVSTDPVESLFGLAKHHGTGEIRDADRIAIRLPALCGIPTREEAERVLEISVADQQELLSRFTSLIKQRRDVLPNPGRLETLSPIGDPRHVELIPRAKNRSNDPKVIALPMGYTEIHGSEPMHANGFG